MAVPTDLLWERDPHTGAKHQILRGYLAAWFPIIASGFGSSGFTFVDAFAGPGEYDAGEEGSPLIALTQACRPDVTRHHTPMNLVFVEERPDRAEHLDALLAERFPATRRPPQMEVHTVTGSAEDVLVRKLEDLNATSGPIFASFDGWGVDTPLDLVQFVGKAPSAEVLVTFQTQWFVRFVNNHEIAAGDRVFGSTEWRDIAAEGPAKDKKSGLVELYRRQLREVGFAYSLTFELIDEGGHSLFLVYGTSSTAGLTKMKDALWDTDPEFGQRFRDPRDVNQLVLDLGAPEPDLRLLAEQVCSRVDQLGKVTLEELKEWALLETVYKPTHVKPAVDQLVSRSLVEVVPARSHAQYLVTAPTPTLFSI
jgi:three-Cys-motif partner protein